MYYLSGWSLYPSNYHTTDGKKNEMLNKFVEKKISAINQAKPSLRRMAHSPSILAAKSAKSHHRSHTGSLS